jgi:hypothetical protein
VLQSDLKYSMRFGKEVGTPTGGCFLYWGLENGGVICADYGVWGARWDPLRIRGVGVA